MNLINEKIERITDCTTDRIPDKEYAEIKSSKFCAVVTECDFGGSSFERTNLSGNSFESSDMSGAHFGEVNLSGAHLEGCDLSGAELTDCKLDGMTIDGFDARELVEFYKANRKEE
ncbi:MAG: pentapeptide repeat-containing protein [Lachnospiraceae bacterium]|nr:pentapeptide repeat-containing protein [Ruminococcus sp.]MCM1274158.1 pentapeptide repeat-containing protein [Lachnospiraceae bacterium]